MTDTVAGRTALITGANSGVGLELTKRLLSEGWDVVALIRSDFAAEEVLIQHARDEGRLRSYTADLGDFAQLAQALDAIRACEERIDVLFNNAGAALGAIRWSDRGHEVHFVINTVVPYIILMELKPLLAQGALKTVVNTSSNALLTLKRFDLGILEHPTKYASITGPYGASKLALSLWTAELAPALASEGITIRSVNPGPNKTKMTGSALAPLWMKLLRPVLFTHPSKGAALIRDAALGNWRAHPGVFINRGRATPLPFRALAPAVLARVQALYAQEFTEQYAPAV